MTFEEFREEKAKGNFKIIGRVDGAHQVGRVLHVIADAGWEPEAGDMFSIWRLRQVHPISKAETDHDVQVVVSRVIESSGAAKVLELGFPLIPDGGYQNFAGPVINNAFLYQPAGDFLMRIRAAWLAVAP